MLDNLELEVYDTYFIQITAIVNSIGFNPDHDPSSNFELNSPELPNSSLNQRIIVAKFSLLDIITDDIHPLVTNLVNQLFIYESGKDPEKRSNTYNLFLVHLSQHATIKNVLFHKYLYSIEDTLQYLGTFQTIQDDIFSIMSANLESPKDLIEMISNMIGIGTINNPAINPLRHNIIIAELLNMICEPSPMKKLEYFKQSA